MKIIDFHAHCFPDQVAAKAHKSVSVDGMLKLSFDCTLDGLVAQMDTVGIDLSVLLPVATKPSQVIGINDWVTGIKNDRIIRFGAIHQDFEDPEGELKRIEALGVHGIKIQPNWQGCRPDDPKMFPIYEASGNRFIFVFHVGGEFKPFPHELATPEAISSLSKLFPNLPIVAAHFGGYRMWDEVDELLIGKNLYLDFSCCYPEYMPDERLIRMIRAHGVEKVLFASDTPSGDPKPQIERLMNLALHDDEREMIAWKNAARILKLEF